MPRIGRKAPFVSTLVAGIVTQTHVDNLGPTEPEYRGRPPLRAHSAEELRASLETMARTDPEFLEWRSAERLGDLFARCGR